MQLPVAPTALLGLLSPLVAGLLGALVVGDFVSPLQLAGFAVALTAMVGGRLPPSRRRIGR